MKLKKFYELHFKLKFSKIMSIEIRNVYFSNTFIFSSTSVES